MHSEIYRTLYDKTHELINTNNDFNNDFKNTEINKRFATFSEESSGNGSNEQVAYTEDLLDANS